MDTVQSPKAHFLSRIDQLPGGVLVSGVLSVLALAYLFQTCWQWYRLSHIPGPFWAAFTKGWMLNEALKRRQPTAIKEVTDRYGSLARVGPNELVTDDPDVLRKMMAVRASYSRGPWYDAMRLEPGRENLFSMRDDAAHTKLRNKMVAGYSGKENESMESTVEKHISNLVNLIDSKYVSTAEDFRPMDFAQKGQYFTLDVISDLAFSKAFGFLEQDDDVFDYIKITSSYIPLMLIPSNVPWVANLLHSPLLRGLLPSDADKLGFGALIGVAKRAVAERFGPSAKSHPDMLGSFIRHGLNQEEASGEAFFQVIAGSDTSASTIRIVLLYILTNPAVYRKLQDEIDNAVAKGKISSPIKDAEGRQLPYLQAVIREGLRIVPPAPGPFFKTVPAGGDMIAGKFIPAGTHIGSSPFGIHRSKKIFGDDADLFRPERWLDSDASRLAEMTSTSDIAFHYGKYQCPGKTVAWMEFNKIFVELLRRFDFSIIHSEKPAQINNAGIWVIEDFWVRITKREIFA